MKSNLVIKAPKVCPVGYRKDNIRNGQCKAVF